MRRVLCVLLVAACGGTGEIQNDAGDAGILPNGPTDAPALPDAPPECGYRDLLANGSFDEGGGWDQRADNGLPVIRPASDLPITPTSAPNAAWLAGYSNGTDRIWQDMRVPDEAVSLYLSASYCAFTLDDDTDKVDDVLGFLVQDPGNAYDTLEVATSLANMDADPGEGACTWKSFRVPLDRPYRGKNIRLKIYGTCDGDGPTDFFLDDVSLEALICP